ncbi:hypothetical protein BTH42_22215 [Burkholderia sp. SRS-W-2-2016]|uniref:DUF2242 domain-containing protein n=1 Tax=Burkholderia sp. SRS-W-2-2016 TaxID=1926878 RepID=UPI00094AC113|nr:hypothetical protein BTH42_22215 [Burkholderia sp. SRS-W-2-2016]
MQIPFFRSTAAAVFGLLALAACSSTPQPKFTQEMFETGASPYARNFNSNTIDSCEAARRALLSQGYLTTMSRPDSVDGTKNFQPTSDTHVVVEFHVVCTPGEEAASSSIVYVNAVQNGFALKKSDTSASVGLSVLGSLSLPIRSNSDAMVKISSETIPSGKFYERFFGLVDHYLQTVVRTQPVTSSAIETRMLPMQVATPLQLTTIPAAVPVTTSAPAAVPAPAQAQMSAPVQVTAPEQITAPAVIQPTQTIPVQITVPAATLSSIPATVQITSPTPVQITTPVAIQPSARTVMQSPAPAPVNQLLDPIDQAAAIEPASGATLAP